MVVRWIPVGAPILLQDRQGSSPLLPFEVPLAVLVAHVFDLIEGAKLEGLVLVDRWTDVFTIVGRFNLLKKGI